MKLLIVGDSHTGALNRGLVKLKKDGRRAPDIDIRIRPLGGGHLLPTAFFQDAGTHAEILPEEYRKSLKQLPPMGEQLDGIGLSMPLWPMRVMHSLVWANYSLSERVNGRRPISQATFRQMVLSDQKYVLALADLLKRTGLRVFAVSPPGLFRDHATLSKIDPAHGLKMFNAYRDIVLQELAQRDVPVIDIPDQCLDSSGFMKQEFRHELPDDEHHADAEFGALMIQAIEKWAQG